VLHNPNCCCAQSGEPPQHKIAACASQERTHVLAHADGEVVCCCEDVNAVREGAQAAHTLLQGEHGREGRAGQGRAG